MKRDYALVQIGFKILLRRGNRFLFLYADHWDLPGGRVDNVELDNPVEKIIAREVKEELGHRIKYKLGKPLFQFKRYSKSRRAHIFITVYDAKYLSGAIELSPEHTSFLWVNPHAEPIRRKDFRSTEEYRIVRKHFMRHA